MPSKVKSVTRQLFPIAAVAALVSPLYSFTAQAAEEPQIGNDVQAQESWRENIRLIAPPEEGCFHVSYPNIQWEKVACSVGVPVHHSSPARAIHKFAMHLAHQEETVGNGTDYVAETSELTNSATGSFPTVTGVTSETGVGVAEYDDEGILGANDYSLQLNTEVDTNSPAGCTQYHNVACGTWQQFVYASNYESGSNGDVFMQYWLFFSRRERCPSGWDNGGSSEGVQSCYKNSATVAVPDVQASQLATVKLSGSTVANGNDTLTFTVGTEAYSTTGKDSVLEMASTWNQSEFNVVGDAGGSKADFNSGSSITVKLAVSSGTTTAPTCLGPSDAGTTGESNNLNLGSCSAASASTPYIQFTESN
jgi:hypothetical protein